jgi:hypothetical protein
MALAAKQMAVSEQMTQRLAEQVGEIPARDLPGGIRNIDTGAAIHTDKAALLREEPTQIVRRDSTEIKRELKARGIILDGTVVEDDPLALPPASDPQDADA